MVCLEFKKLQGLIAATYTPFDDAGRFAGDQVAPMVDHLISQGVGGLYVCGSTGEGVSMSSAERREAAEAFVCATDKQVPVIVQVGHNSLTEAQQLAAHAQQIGADAISATAPWYFKPATIDLLIDSMAELAAGAPDLPFYYYHIPKMTGVNLPMAQFLRSCENRIPNLAGIKYTEPTIHEFQHCLALENERFDLLWGTDEMLLSALGVGARGAVGSTYNIAAPIYRRIIDCFDSGQMSEARQLQLKAVQMIDIIARFPFHPASKELLKLRGLNVGRCRLPLPCLSKEDVISLRTELDAIGFFDWSVQT